MLNGLFTGGIFRGLGPFQPPPEVDGMLYAVGDLHGRVDLLEAMMARLLDDVVGLPERPANIPKLVFVGDVIDRGPDTRAVIEFLMAVRQWPEFETQFVAGNHEMMLLLFLDQPVKGRSWLRHGGYETLLSYGLERLGDIDDPDDLRRLADGLSDAMGPHRAFIEDMVPSVRDGNVLLTHAGADPDLPVEVQPPRTLAWGCDSFLKKRRRDGVWVVYGHTIMDAPSMRHGRIAIDTGAYVTGCLTALRLHGAEATFLSVSGDAGEE